MNSGIRVSRQRGFSPATENVTEPSVPGGIRTPNLLIRSQKLYPVELQAHFVDPKPQAPKPKVNRIGAWNLGFAKPGGRRDSNPQQPEPQSGALPLSYGHHHCQGTRLKFESLFANKGLDFLGVSSNSRRWWYQKLPPVGLSWRRTVV